jgi:trigger factor
MQVTETLAEGLKREYQVTVPAADLAERVSGALEDLRTKVRINGFRPGKVPTAHLRRLYGRAVFAEILETVLNEANQKIIGDNQLRLAMQPKVSLGEDEKEVESIVTGGADLSYKVALEVLPQIEIGDLATIKVDRPKAAVTDAEVGEALAALAKRNRSFEPRGEGEAAAEGDRLTIDYKGTVDGEAFEGGEGTDITVELGSNSFIPGFEEKLVGAKAGEERTVEANFPGAYLRQDLAGKTGMFAVTVKKVERPIEKEPDDEFAKSLGTESLDDLKGKLREQLEKDHAAASRQRLKRRLLDQLDAMHRFEVPPTLLQQEFDNIWAQVERDLQGTTPEKPEDELKAEYRAIAERRVRLGLLLAQIGERADIKVPDEDVTRAVVERARQFPGQEQRVWEFYQKNPEALAELRAPLFEEKVVDYVSELATVSDKEVSREELFTDPDEPSTA